MVGTKIVLLWSSIFILIGCKKPEDRACWKKKGEDTELTLPLSPALERIAIHQRLGLHLVQDLTQDPYIKIKGGANLISHIAANEDGSWLVIEDENKCGFIRKNKEAVEIEVNMHQLKDLWLDNGANVTNEDTLHYEGLKITVEKYATGDVDLTLKANEIAYQNYQDESVVNLVFRGEVAHLVLEHNGYGTLNAEQGNFQQVDIIHYGINDVYVKGSTEINAFIKSRGNIWVSGNGVLNTFLEGSGKVTRP